MRHDRIAPFFKLGKKIEGRGTRSHAGDPPARPGSLSLQSRRVIRVSRGGRELTIS